MFTMAKIRDGSTYLGSHLTQNDYYCEKETVSGTWQGKGAELLELKGVIEAGNEAFEALRKNRHPETGQRLTSRDGEGRICFYDFQCSAQKSVSVMAVTLGDQRLIDAHDAAVKTAFSELERFAATQENTAISRHNRTTSNVVAAAFRHTASRALDPQVHTHHVVANATWDEKTQSWRALTEFEMVKAIRYAGKVYQNELARACIKLGYEIETIRDEKGRTTGFEISGVSAEVRERFSKRRAEVEQGIEEFRQKHGRAPTPAETHNITVNSRNAKLAETTTPEVLRAQLAQLSSEEKVALGTLKRDAEQKAHTAPEQGLLPLEKECFRYATGHLFERRSVSVGHEVLAEALNAGLGRIDLPALKHTAEQSALIRVGDAQWLHAPLVTEKGLHLEKWSVEHVAETKDRHAPFALVERGSMPALSDGQFKAVSEILCSKDQVVCLRGAAGVGKTTMVKAMQVPLETDGRRVFYCAPTSSAAETLRKDGINHATTVSDFIQNVAISRRLELERAVFVVDEAGLSSNTQGAQLLRLANECNARVIFLGDSRQHSSVEAGDFLRILERHSPLHRVEVTDIRRQQEAGYREAIQLMALGASKAGLEKLDQLGCVKEGKAAYLEDAVKDFLRHTKQPSDLGRVMAVTPTWAENHAFTEHLRRKLKERDLLGAGEKITCLESLQWTQAQKSKAEHYQPGMVVKFAGRQPGFEQGRQYVVTKVCNRIIWVDTAQGEKRLPLRGGHFDVMRSKEQEVCPGERLLVLANDRKQGLVNGEALSVQGIRDGIIETVEGKRIDTRAFASLGYGYAVTSHKSQSKTVDHVVVAAERLDAKSAYVACSRGRQSCTVHTPDRANLIAHLPDGNRTAAMEAIGCDPRAETRSPADLLSNRQRKDVHERNQQAERWSRQVWWRGLTGGLRNLWQRLTPGHSVDAATHREGRKHDRDIT